MSTRIDDDGGAVDARSAMNSGLQNTDDAQRSSGDALKPSKDGGEHRGQFTPPLPNGQKRLHPLLDEDRIAKQAAEGALSGYEAGSSDKYVEHADGDTDEGSADEAKTLRIMESIASDAGYPSPSGGFVPPVTDQDWSLADAPMTRARRATSSSSSSANPLQSTVTGGRTSTGSGLPSLTAAAASAAGAATKTAATSPSTMAAPQATRAAQFVEDAGVKTRHRASSSISSTLSSSLHSQAISARSSPSTVAPNRRRSSGSADVLSHVGGNDAPDDDVLPPLKVRDYAFDESDPRHVGARDVSLPSPSARAAKDSGDEMMGMLGGGAIAGLRLGLGGGGGGAGVHEWAVSTEEYEEDDDDDIDDAGEESDGGVLLSSAQPSNSSLGQSGLPLGLYYAAYDFSAESEHELDVKVGQRVRLIGHVDGGWAIVVRVGQGQEDISADDEEADKGLVPEAYLQWLAD